MRTAIFFTFLLALGLVNCSIGVVDRDDEYVPSIDGMQGISLKCNSDEKLSMVREFEGMPGFDFLKVARSGDVDLLLTSEHTDSFKHLLDSHGVEYKVFVQDVKPIVEKQFAQKRRVLSQRSLLRSIDASDWHFPDYDNEIVGYLRRVSEEYSQHVSLFSIGRSFEQREIYGVKISTGPERSSGAAKPAVLIDAGIHAREWIAPTTALYAIRELALNASGNRDVLDYVDYYIIPVLNPDGYQYTHSAPQNRMWRKTRSRIPGTRCRGVDANRNFGLKWNVVGASQNPCSEVYSGPRAFSEPEAQSLKEFVLKHPGVFRAYLSLHSYGQYILHPWGFTRDLPANEPTLRCAGVAAERELSKVRGTRYSVGSSTRLLYAAAGGSDDWTMGIAGVNISYTVELPGGYAGFAPEPEEILPVGQETFQALRSFGKFAAGHICA